MALHDGKHATATNQATATLTAGAGETICMTQIISESGTITIDGCDRVVPAGGEIIRTCIFSAVGGSISVVSPVANTVSISGFVFNA